MSVSEKTTERKPILARVRTAVAALEPVAIGLITAILALGVLLCVVLTAVLCLVGVGFLLAPLVLRLVRVAANRERARLTRMGPDVMSPGPVPVRLTDALRDSAVQRELTWLGLHATAGLFLGMSGVTMALATIRDGAMPLYWQFIPAGEATPQIPLWTIHDTTGAIATGLLGVGWVFLSVALMPGIAQLQALPGRRLLPPGPDFDVTLRIAHLTATRAAALDAHATELRRIERWLHDGTQNRLVAVNVMLGAARRALTRDPESADAMLGRAQDAAEEALTELRAVVRSILPPVLADRSLGDAVTALAANSPVDCRVDADLPGRCAASVEASAYFIIAEALTNIAKHAHAQHALVVLRRHENLIWIQISDDGRGGADESGGSGLGGIRRRIEAHDGTFTLVSPTGGPTTLTVSLPCGL